MSVCADRLVAQYVCLFILFYVIFSPFYFASSVVIYDSIYTYIYNMYIYIHIPVVTLFPATRLTKAYDVTIQRYRNSRAKIEDSKMHILRCMGSKPCVKFQRCPLKFHTKFWTLTPHNMHFTGCLLSLSETGPRTPCILVRLYASWYIYCQLHPVGERTDRYISCYIVRDIFQYIMLRPRDFTSG